MVGSGVLVVRSSVVVAGSRVLVVRSGVLVVVVAWGACVVALATVPNPKEQHGDD